jgi:UDP-galactopyranose mutase
MTIDNKSFEMVKEFKYFGTNLTNQNSIQEEIKGSLKPGNNCYYSMQNLLSSSLLSIYLNIMILKNIILPVIFMGVKLGRSHCGRNVGRRRLRIGC